MPGSKIKPTSTSVEQTAENNLDLDNIGETREEERQEIERGYLEGDITDSEIIMGQSTERPPSDLSYTEQADYVFKQTGAFSGFRDDFLIINDVVMTGIAQSAISIESSNNTFVAETLRSASPVVTSTGTESWTLTLSLIFPPGQEQSKKLHRLISEMIRNPLVYIFNGRVNKALGIGDSTISTIFIVETGTLRNSSDVGSIVLDLTMHYFNYKPFSNRFLYKTRMPGFTRAERPPVEYEQPASLVDVSGYESSDYSLDYDAERVIRELRDGTIRLKDAPTVPVNLPAASDAWMFYAEHLESLTPKIPERTSDFVGFSLDIYEYHNPPPEARDGKGSMRERYEVPFKATPFSPIYDAQAKSVPLPDGPVKVASGREAELAGEEEARRPHISASGRKWKEAYESLFIDGHNPWKKGFKDPTEEEKKLIKRTGIGSLKLGRQLSPRLGEGGRVYDYQGQSKCNLVFFETLYRAGYKTPLMKRKLGWGYPNVPGLIRQVTSNPKWCLRLTGQSPEHIQKVIDSGIPVGLAWKPKGHVMILSKINRLVYDSKKRITDAAFMYWDQSGKRKSQPHTRSKHTVEIFQAIPAGEKPPKYPTPPALPQKAKKPKTAEQQKKQKELRKQQSRKNHFRADSLDNNQMLFEGESRIDDREAAEKNVAAAKTLHEERQKIRKRLIRKRKEWIASKEREGLTYYRDDPKLRNIFSKRENINISSITSAQERGQAAKNIVFSGISVSFGHRIVPIKFTGQDRYAWQFLGAGNRTGTMVFTLSGKEGHKSADELKAMLYLARENARIFGSVIPEAGSLTVRWKNPDTQETNSILALLGSKTKELGDNDEHTITIVPTDITETTTADGVDQSQLQVNFIVQEFAEEKLERRFLTPIDLKKRIVRGLMNLLTVDLTSAPEEKTDEHEVEDETKKTHAELRESDYQKIIPFPYIMTSRVGTEAYNAEIQAYEDDSELIGGLGRPYKMANPNFPSWLAGILAETAEFCSKINEEIPPTTWKYNIITSDRWIKRYAEWGAAGVMKGRVKNIPGGELNHKPQGAKTELGIDRGPTGRRPQRSVTRKDRGQSTSNWQDMLNGNFTHDGGPQTNKLHERYFNKWTDKMDALVRRVKGFVSDEENFEEYFPGVSESILESAVNSIGTCYSDMFLPNHPTIRTRTLPPEFYIYDDSGEDPALSALTDENSMEKKLSKHIDNEVASIERFAKHAIAGGSYISRNLPKIIESRKQYLDRFAGKDRKDKASREWEGEVGFHTGSKMMQEGTRAWEPIFYRPNDEAYSREGAKEWMSHITEKLNQGQDTDDTQFNFMDNIIKLSPYLRDGHGKEWDLPYTSAPPDYLLNTLYDDDWRDLSFGPNAEYQHSDGAIAGKLPDKNNRAAMRRVQEAKAKAKAIADKAAGEESPSVEAGHKMTALGDGTMVVGTSPLLLKHRQTEAFDKGREKFEREQGESGYDDWNEEAIAKEKAAKAEEINEAIDKFDHKSAGALFGSHEQEKNKIAKLGAKVSVSTKSKDISVRRVFPTFKIYFIEEDSDETEQVNGAITRAFDDFYSYSSIQEIRVSRSRKVAGDLAVIRMTNIGGSLLRRRWGDKAPEDVKAETDKGIGAEYATGILADTEKENPFERMVLQDGVKVQIRLGYASEPDDLETVFLGSIVEINPTENGKILEITCQGYGAELQGVELGPLEDGPLFFSSQSVLSGSIIQDSIVNFGRRSRFNRFAPGESRESYTGGTGRLYFLGDVNPFKLFDLWGSRQLYKQIYKYSFRNHPQDDNIFAPPPDTYANFWERFFNNACLYRPLKQTPWQIFKEHELRHPGYISLAVPYGHSTRMTMFFGAKGQHYWARPPSSLELYLSENASDALIRMRGMSKTDATSHELVSRLAKIKSDFPRLSNSIIGAMTSVGSAASVSKEIASLFGRYVPFRNYHYFDSSHHILKNEIRTSLDGTFNEVEVLYFDNEDDIAGAGSSDTWNIWTGFAPNPAGEEGPSNVDNIRALQAGEKGVYTSKLDENIPEEYIRSYRQEFPSCVTQYMAKRYAQGLFCRLLRDCYKGELCVLGEPTLKPYDICYLNDTRINMTGPIEVEAVEHIFSRDHGFISIITPDLCVDMNDFYSLSVMDVTAAAMDNVYKNHVAAGEAKTLSEREDPDFFTNDLTLRVAASLTSPFVFLGALASVKFMMCMQEGTPVITTPLTLGGKPFMSAALGQNRVSLMTTLNGKWEQWWDDLKTGWDKVDIAEEIFHTRLDITESIANFARSGPTSISESE